MILAVVGSRNFNDYDLVCTILDEVCRESGVETLVSGGASGADTLAEWYAKDRDLPITVIKPDWDRYGKVAGFVRNTLIVRDCDKVVAFWDGKSKGTKYTIDTAKSYGKPVYIVMFGEGAQDGRQDGDDSVGHGEGQAT